MNRNDILMGIAEKVLNDGNITIVKEGNIKDSYNGQIAALGASIALSGFCATLATYYKNSNNDTRAVDRKPILEIIARMIREDKPIEFPQIRNAESLMAVAIRANEAERKKLQKEFVECTIALKQIVRTYNLI